MIELRKITRIFHSFKLTEFILVTTFAAALSIFIGRGVLFQAGTIILAENFEVDSLAGLGANYQPYWQKYFQYFDFGITDSVYLFAFFLKLAQIIGLSFAAVQRLILLIPHGIAFLTMYYLARHIYLKTAEQILEKTKIIVSFSSAIIYAINPWITVQPRDIALRFDYALTPLMVLLFFKIIENKRGFFKYIIGFTLVLAFTACFRYLMIIIPMFLIFLIISGDRDKDLGQNSINWIGRTGLILVFFFLFSAGKLLSPILYSLNAKQIPYLEAYHEEMIGQATIFDVLSTKVLNSSARKLLDDTYSNDSYKVFIIISISSFLYLVISRRKLRRWELFFPMIIVLMLPLAVLREAPFGNFNLWLLTQAPLSQIYGRLLRFADWNTLPILLSISVMSGITLRVLFEVFKLELKQAALWAAPLVIFGLCAISSRPLLTGDLNGYWKPSTVAEEFKAANARLAEDGADFHVLWLPAYWENKAVWAGNRGIYESTAPSCNFDIRSSIKPSYLMEHFYVFDYYNILAPRPGFIPLEGYGGDHIADIYKSFNIRYIVIHNDVNWNRQYRILGFDDEKISRITDSLANKPDFELVMKDNSVTMFKLSSDSREYNISQPVCVYGGLPVQGALADAGINLEHISLIYLDNVRFSWEEYQKIIGNCTAMLIKGKSDYRLALNTLAAGSENLISPYEHTLRHNPVASWSKARIQAGIGDAQFQEALYALGIEPWSWDFDYGEGLVFTTASKAEMSFPVYIREPGHYIIVARYFANQKGGVIVFSLGSYQIPQFTEEPGNFFKWDTLPPVYLPKGKHTLTMKNIYGLNALNLVGVVPWQQMERTAIEVDDLLESVNCFYIYEGESDLAEEGVKLECIKDRTSSNGRVLSMRENTTAKCHFDLSKDGDYHFQFRIKGKFQVEVDSLKFNIQSDDMKFISLKVPALDKGMHKLTLRPRKYPSLIDVLWFGIFGEGGGFEEWIANLDHSGKLVSAAKTNDSNIELQMKASEPFLLTVAEGYDPQIAAYSEGGKYSSIPTGGLINGFLIDDVNAEKIEVEFIPQKWAQTGIKISLVSFYIICAYFFLSWFYKAIGKIKKPD